MISTLLKAALKLEFARIRTANFKGRLVFGLAVRFPAVQRAIAVSLLTDGLTYELTSCIIVVRIPYCQY